MRHRMTRLRNLVLLGTFATSCGLGKSSSAPVSNGNSLQGDPSPSFSPYQGYWSTVDSSGAVQKLLQISPSGKVNQIFPTADPYYAPITRLTSDGSAIYLNRVEICASAGSRCAQLKVPAEISSVEVRYEMRIANPSELNRLETPTDALAHGGFPRVVEEFEHVNANDVPTILAQKGSRTSQLGRLNAVLVHYDDL